MSNRDLWNYYMATRGARHNPGNANIDPPSPPYENLNVTDVTPTISLRETQKTPSQTPVIPGPAQIVRRGLFRKRAHDAQVLRGESSQPRSTQDFIREAINEQSHDDQDFRSPLWTSSIDYIIREGSYKNRTQPLWTNIGEIHTPRDQFLQVKKVVAMVATVTPNGLGDLLVTLKDPSGKIDGTMHHNIFQNDDYKRTTGVGAVLILKNVTVCRFDRNTNYLNITDRNIVKIIGANSMIAEYQPTDVTSINEAGEGTSGYDSETVPDSEDD